MCRLCRGIVQCAFSYDLLCSRTLDGAGNGIDPDDRAGRASLDRNLGVVLCPGYPGHPAAEVRRERIGEAEMASVGDVRVVVNQGEVMELDGRTTDAVAAVMVGDRFYSIETEGILSET